MSHIHQNEVRKIALAVTFVALVSMAPRAKAAQQASNVVPTSIAGVTTSIAPPPGFDPLSASDGELATYGFPPRPDQAAAPQAYASWARAMAASKVRVFPQLAVTNIQNERNRKAPSPGGNVAEGVAYSYNWSGPVAFSGASKYGSTSFYYIISDFVVPIAQQAIGACTGAWDYASAWDGIDGDGSGDVLQAGVEFDAYCSGGVTSPYYSAWYEWYPYSEVRISSLPVTAGDDMYVEVWDTTATQGYCYIVNENTDKYVQIGFTPPSGSSLIGNSAEWVVEAPTVGGSIAAMTNYTQDFFANSFAYTFSGALYDPGNAATLFDMIDTKGCVQSFPTLLGSYGIWFEDENATRFSGSC